MWLFDIELFQLLLRNDYFLHLDRLWRSYFFWLQILDQLIYFLVQIEVQLMDVLNFETSVHICAAPEILI